MAHMSPRLKARRNRFGAGGVAPSVKITSPASNYLLLLAGSPSTLAVTGEANDDVDGDVSANIVWTSDKELSSSPLAPTVLGTGAAADLALTVVGVHKITATITATTGSPLASRSASIYVTVQ